MSNLKCTCELPTTFCVCNSRPDTEGDRFVRYAEQYFDSPQRLVVGDIINQIVKEYQDPTKGLILRDALHLAMKMGYMMKTVLNHKQLNPL